MKNLLKKINKYYKKAIYFLRNKVSKKVYLIGLGVVFFIMVLIIVLDMVLGNRKVVCKFNGEMTQGAEFINGVYTYHYMQDGNNKKWKNISEDGWGVKLTDTNVKEVDEAPCTIINDKPVISASYMFANAKELSLVNVSSFNTSNITDMSNMFYMAGKDADEVKILGLNKLDTSNVTNMSKMFAYSGFKSSRYVLDGIRKLDTSNVTDMSGMFNYTAYKAKEVVFEDISSWDVSKVTDVSNMFDSFAYYAQTLDLGKIDKWKISDKVSQTDAFMNMGITSKYKVPSWYTGETEEKYNSSDGGQDIKTMMDEKNILKGSNSLNKKEDSSKKESSNEKKK